MYDRKFENLRLVISVQGYLLSDRLIIREIGFWNRIMTGLLYFNHETEFSSLDSFGKKNIVMAHEEIHAINWFDDIENGFDYKQAPIVLKTLYQLSKVKDSENLNLIGIFRGEHVDDLITRAELDAYKLEMESLDIMHESNIVHNLPRFNDYHDIIAENVEKFPPCRIHKNLNYNVTPICALSKVNAVIKHIDNLSHSNKQTLNQKF